MKRGTIEHVKMHRLAERLNLPRYAAVGILESLWHMTATKAPSGDISNLTAEDIAFYIQWNHDPVELIDALVLCRWLDKDGDKLLVHDWQDHAEDSVKKWLTRKGMKFADKTRQVQECLDMSGHVVPALALAVAVAPALATAKPQETASALTAAKPASEPETKITWTIVGGFENITDQDRQDWATAYPACTLDVQLAQMTQWLKANPAKAHKSQWRRFITGWLARSQERGGDVASNRQTPGSPGPPQPPMTIADALARTKRIREKQELENGIDGRR